MFRLSKALLPQMKDGGSIINTASIQSFDPSPNLLSYASRKAAIVSFTRSCASLAIKQGVRPVRAPTSRSAVLNSTVMPMCIGLVLLSQTRLSVWHHPWRLDRREIPM